VNGSETCRIEDELAVALDGRDGLRWLGVYLAIAQDAGFRPEATRQALQDLRRVERAHEMTLARLRTARGALPRGRDCVRNDG
jgi:hypothetical protein